jgi:hypothetical protein
MEGVYIPRRDTNSGFNKAFGGRVFPGIFNRSTFHVSEDEKHLSIQIIRADGGEEAAFSGEIAERLPETSIFPTLKDASDFFILGSTGYSATCEEGHYHGMELSSQEWSIAPVDVVHARSAFFANAEAFPEGSIQLDCALVMRKIAHEWHSRPDLYVSADGKCLTTKRKAA